MCLVTCGTSNINAMAINSINNVVHANNYGFKVSVENALNKAEQLLKLAR